MLKLTEHNAHRLKHLMVRDDEAAGVDCDKCYAPMVLAAVVQRVGGPAPGVDVKCPRCGHRGVMIL